MPIALLLLACASAPEPVAVAPFANLNHDGSLAWLEQGAAETIAADLRKSGTAVVERAQIAEAIAQVTAQARDDVARAVAAGRITGAKSIVLGSFQRAGSDVRLIARVVDVETGAVADAAKATGPLDDVFRLQDEIVRALAKKPPAPRTKKPSALAYAKLGAALTAPVADQRALLGEALAVDPDFVYARDALSALEARMHASAATAATALDARSAALLVVVRDASTPADRRQAAARAVVDGLAAARRYHGLVAAADAVIAAGLAADVVDDVNERAAAARVTALAALVEVDHALQAGERYLAAFPTGAHRADVEHTMHALVDDRRSEPGRRTEYLDELKAGAATSDALARDFHPCIAAKWSKLPAEMTSQCTHFLEQHGADANPDAREHVVSARAYVAWGHALRGDFAAAHALADALERDVPGSLESTGLRVAADRWCTD